MTKQMKDTHRRDTNGNKIKENDIVKLEGDTLYVVRYNFRLSRFQLTPIQDKKLSYNYFIELENVNYLTKISTIDDSHLFDWAQCASILEKINHD